jgi:hypothetical protein
MTRLDSVMNLPPFVVPREASIILFVVILIVVPSAAVAGIHVARRSMDKTVAFAMTVLLWMAATGTWVAIGGTDASLAGFVGFFAISMLGALVLGLSPVGRWWAAGLPIWALVAFQGFRLPLEIVLHWWAEDRTIPETMTWTGSNLDVISGVVAIAAAPWSRHRAVAWFANVVGIVLLANVARVAVLSSPVPFGWNVDPPLMLAMHLPYAWIVPICVGGALCGHIVLTRALLGTGLASSAREVTHVDRANHTLD